MAADRDFFLKEWRKYRGLTQQQLADAADLTKGFISNLERGQKRYNEDNLAAVAQVLKCEPWEIIGRNPLANDAGGAELIDIWDRMTASQRDTAVRVLRSLSEGTG